MIITTTIDGCGFAKPARLQEHLSGMAGKLSAAEILGGGSLAQLYGNPAVACAITTHCIESEIEEPVASIYPEINMQLLYMYLSEGGDYRHLDAINIGAMGLKHAVEFCFAQDGWASLDEAFKDPLCENARWLQAELSKHLIKREVQRASGMPNMRAPIATLEYALTIGFLCVSAGQAQMGDHYISGAHFQSLDAMLGVSGHGYGFHTYSFDEILSVAHNFKRYIYSNVYDYHKFLGSLDRLLHILSRLFVATWARQGVDLTTLSDELSKRVRALKLAFHAPTVIETALFDAVSFRSFFSFKSSWQQLGLKWEMGLGFSLEHLAHYRAEHSSYDWYASPVIDLPLTGGGPLGMSDNMPHFRGMLEHLLEGSIEPNCYSNRLGSYLIPAHALMSPAGYQVINEVCVRSAYLKDMAPKACANDYVLENLSDDALLALLTAIARRVVKGECLTTYRIGRTARKPSVMIDGVRENRPHLLSRVFADFASQNAPNLGRLRDNLDISGTDFSGEQMNAFSAAAKRLLICHDMGV